MSHYESACIVEENNESWGKEEGIFRFMQVLVSLLASIYWFRSFL